MEPQMNADKRRFDLIINRKSSMINPRATASVFTTKACPHEEPALDLIGGGGTKEHGGEHPSG